MPHKPEPSFGNTKSYQKDPASGRYDKDHFRVSTVEVEEQEGKEEPFRYIIRNDGSGGPRLQQRNERCVSDGFDHDLAPRK